MAAGYGNPTAFVNSVIVQTVTLCHRLTMTISTGGKVSFAIRLEISNRSRCCNHSRCYSHSHSHKKRRKDCK